jgi:hypothetical protein
MNTFMRINSKFERAIPPDNMDSVLSAIAWIERAQDADSSGGVPAVYAPVRGWAPPYPETTGYIIPTFLALAARLDRRQLAERAIRMGEWLLSIQYPDGAFPGSVWVAGTEARRSVFNSGQILFGLVALWKATKEARWQDAGLRCARWLLSNQDPDGAWRRFAYRDTFHVYKTRVAWAMGLAGKHWDDAQLVEGAIRNVENALGFQDQQGWFEHVSFDEGTAPVLHTYVYTVQGVLEAGLLLHRQDFVDRAVLSSQALGRSQSSDGSLPGRVRYDFSSSGFRCLTGIAQQVIVWGRLRQVGDQRGDWARHSAAALDYLRKVQVDKPGHVNNGGFAGSRPVWGPYMRFRYPNWAVKFYLDAVIANAQLMDEEAWG